MADHYERFITCMLILDAGGSTHYLRLVAMY
jgi:hypothetical protein